MDNSLLLPPFTVMIRNFKVGSFVSRYATTFYIKKRVVVSEQSLVTKIEDFVGQLNGFAFVPFEEITSPRFRANDTIDPIVWSNGLNIPEPLVDEILGPVISSRFGHKTLSTTFKS